MYLFERAEFRVLCLKNRLFERGFSYRDQLVWDVLQAADVVHCCAKHLQGGELARQKLEALQVQLQAFPDLFAEMGTILQTFHQAVMRRRRWTLVHPNQVTDIFLTPGGVLAYVTSHR